MSYRNEAHELGEMMAARAKRAIPLHQICFWANIWDFDPETGMVKVYYPHVANTPTWAQWLRYVSPAAIGGYGMQYGPERGALVLVLQMSLDPQNADDAIVIGGIFNDPNPPPGAQSSELFIVDKRGSSIKLQIDGQNEGDGQAGLNLEGAGYASLVAPLVEAGAKNLDPVQQALLRFSDLVAYHNWLFGTALPAWAVAQLQPGSGAAGPPPQDPPILGSQTVRAAD